MTQDDRRKRGEEMFEAVYGGVVPVPQGEARDEFFHFTLDTLFAEVWSRNSMSIRDRRLVAMGVMAALGEKETFEIQLRAALKNGELVTEQLKDLLIFLTQYIGYPRTTHLLAIVRRLLADEKGRDRFLSSGDC